MSKQKIKYEQLLFLWVQGTLTNIIHPKITTVYSPS